MPEDKLTHDERLRLECLAQAIASFGHSPTIATVAVIGRAKSFEKYVSGEMDQ